MDIDRNLKMAMKTGKLYFGAKQARRAAEKGEAKVIIRASNVHDGPDLGDVKVVEYKGTAMELGSACGKPFAITHIAVIDGGKSELERA